MQQVLIEFPGIEPGQAKIEVSLLKFCQFGRQQFLVPRDPSGGTVDQQPEGLDLRRRPLITEDHWKLCKTQLAGGFEAQVPVNQLAVTADQARDLETELPNTAAHAVYRRIIFSRILSVHHQLVNRPGLDLHGYLVWHPGRNRLVGIGF
jgi:hypothetical protein